MVYTNLYKCFGTFLKYVYTGMGKGWGGVQAPLYAYYRPVILPPPTYNILLLLINESKELYISKYYYNYNETTSNKINQIEL